MNILVVGGGGREHALTWKIAQSPLADRLYCAPGNAGIAQVAECVDIDPADVASLLDFARQQNCELTVVGPEAPLVAGIVDTFEEAGLMAFGPSRRGAELEGSKVFSKRIMQHHGVPTASFHVLEAAKAAHRYVNTIPVPLVVKADGLAGGKGVIVCGTAEEGHDAVRMIMEDRQFGEAGVKVVIEECLTGEETSIIAFTDGRTILPLAASQDHKPVFDGDSGPNTGGMGAYAPAPCVTPELMREIEEKVLVRMVHALRHEKRRYRGVLYAGIMLTPGGPKTLEFNCRFGDPETQPLVMLMKSDIVPVMLATVEGRLGEVELEWHEGAAVCVVMASGGYPGSYEKGKLIEGLDEAAKIPDVQVFHAGTASQDGKIVTAGGRVLGVTGRGLDVAAAIETAYRGVRAIGFEGAYYRTDIGAKALSRRDAGA